MHRNSFFIVLTLLAIVSVCGCQREPHIKKNEITQKQANEALIAANKARLKVESQKIDTYAKRRNWKMNKTESGLRYYIYKSGEKILKPSKGSVAVINYKISLMDGKICYSSDSSGTKGFTVGKGEIEKGIDEGILLMNKGDKAKFILPSHLGYGLLGDEIKIPSHAVLVYDVSLVDIN